MPARRRAERCRVCRAWLPVQALLCYEDMPGAAQKFPSADELTNDHGTPLAIHQCPHCGLVQIAGAPVPYYREVIRASAFSPEMRAFRQQQFRQWVETHALSGKAVLEIGCGRGEYLSLLAEAGVRAHGIEAAPAAVDACRAAGLSVARDFIERPRQRLQGAPFDAFVTLNFMEHWPAPVSTLRGIHHNLAEGAVGLVEVPNFTMILERKLYSEFISDHLSYFTRETFAFALHSAGFDVLNCRSVWHDYILSAEVRRRRSLDLAPLAERRQGIRDALHAFIDRFPPRSVAVWGAGHQALATIALCGIGEKLNYVVDSAPFKQGRYTPASHLPIVAPEALTETPPSAIIVMAAAYTDEVHRLIRARHGDRFPVALLRDDGLSGDLGETAQP
ncbi:methyltransferase domain-containing protein [Rhodocyclus tenuis]|uniref:class I SAM-dependent methyltransferase n=1 Tax=Rhodocyclus gracilis TaxID=2929842 RepID=UPI0012989BCB|nr:class I SAM-dependent methyltransferase [Rhodocyclus gracilis]MRD73044.1 methyltransferase domain-containing protein [Rhodocyclus gracilis]